MGLKSVRGSVLPTHYTSVMIYLAHQTISGEHLFETRAETQQLVRHCDVTLGINSFQLFSIFSSN